MNTVAKSAQKNQSLRGPIKQQSVSIQHDPHSWYTATTLLIRALEIFLLTYSLTFSDQMQSLPLNDIQW